MVQMKKKLNLVNNLITFTAFLISAISGILLLDGHSGKGLRLGSEAITGQLIYGISRHGWSDIHTISSILLVVLVALHIALHWYWFKRLPDKLGKKLRANR